MCLDPRNDHICRIRIDDDDIDEAAFLTWPCFFPCHATPHSLPLCLQVVFDAYKRKGRARKYVTPNEVTHASSCTACVSIIRCVAFVFLFRRYVKGAFDTWNRLVHKRCDTYFCTLAETGGTPAGSSLNAYLVPYEFIWQPPACA